MEIHQLLVSAAPGDAITAEALLLRTCLERVGTSYIFAEYVHPGLHEVHHLSAYPRMSSARTGDNLLIVHGSIGDQTFFDFLRRRPEQIVLRYHNMTPPELVRGYDAPLAALLARGRDDLAAIAGRVRVAIATSTFSAAGLAGLGLSNIVVVPVLFDARALHDQPAPDEAVWALSPPQGRPLVLFVGRLVPHKNQSALLAAFHVLKTYLRPDAHLALVGGGPQGAYIDSLHRFVDRLGLTDVTITGEVPAATLAAAYRRADAFVCLSRHEGFGVPLVEAMTFGVPIVAWDVAAVGEVVGDAGVLLDSPSPTLVAEATAAVLDQSPVRQRLIERGRARAAGYAVEHSGAALLQALLAAV